MPMRVWFRREAARLGISVHAVMTRYYRGHYGNLKLRREANGRVMVLPGGWAPTRQLVVVDRNIPGECGCGRPGRRAGDKSWVCPRCARIEHWLSNHFHRDPTDALPGSGLPEYKIHVAV